MVTAEHEGQSHVELTAGCSPEAEAPVIDRSFWFSILIVATLAGRLGIEAWRAGWWVCAGIGLVHGLV